MIEISHIGTTVLCLNPTPNGRYAPFGKYANPGFNIWIDPNNKTNIRIENGSLYILSNFLVMNMIYFIIDGDFFV